MADGSGGGQADNDDAVQALFSGVNARSRAMGQARGATQVHLRTMPRHAVGVPTHVGRAQMRAVPAADFDKISARKLEGVPRIGLAPPKANVPEAGEQLVKLKRQMAGLPPNNRSNTIQVDPNVTSQQTIPLLQFNGQSDDTDLLVLQLGGPTFAQAVNLAYLPSPGFGSAQALLQWGVGNVQFSAQVDWVLGTTLALPANYLAVTAVIPAGSGVLPGPPFMTLGAAVAYGVSPGHRNRARLTNQLVDSTTGLTSIAAGDTTTAIPVPAFAIGFGILTGPTVPGGGNTGTPVTPIGVRIQDLNGAAQLDTDFVLSVGNNTGWQGGDMFPVVNGGRQLVAKNQSASAARIWVIWDIAL